MDAAAAAHDSACLNTATDLFYREGINATGVERLASEASVSKRPLYQHFPSKAAVVDGSLTYVAFAGRR